MPAHSMTRSPAKKVAAVRQSLSAFDALFDAAFSPRTAPDSSPTLTPADLVRPMAPVPPSTTLGSPLQTSVTSQPEGVVVDPVWDEIRQTKEKHLAALPSKVKSLEGVASPVAVQPGAGAQLGKGRSSVDYKESLDGRTVTATFEIPGVKKQDMHVSFRSKCVIVSWRMMHTDEKKEGGALVRRYVEKNYSHTIPLPEGTKFEEIHASRDGRQLILTYPNSRCIRIGSHPAPRTVLSGATEYHSC